jgi:hypothetical protein
MLRFIGMVHATAGLFLLKMPAVTGFLLLTITQVG